MPWSVINETERTASVPLGLLAGIMIDTANTASLPPAFNDTPTHRWSIARDVSNTSSTFVARIIELLRTDAGPAMSPTVVTAMAPRRFGARDAIFELRRLSGLTWEELAQLLQVSRRSLHLWANGQPINAPNEKRLRDLVSAMRMLDRGTARENRALLMAPLPEGGAFSDLLTTGRFSEALQRVGRGRGRATPIRDAGSDPKRIVQMSIEDTFSTRSDRVHSDDSVALLGRQRRRPRQG